MKEYFPTYYKKNKLAEMFEEVAANDKKQKEIEDIQLNYHLRDLILEKYHIKVLYENGEYCLFKNGIYQRNQKRNVEQIIGWMLEQEQLKFSIQRQKTILELIAQATYTSIEDFDQDFYLLNLNNGLFNLKTKEFKEHDSNILQFRRINVNYDKDARCPLINKFLREIFHEEDIPFIKEFFALCMTPIMKYQKALLLHGVGNNGKTTFLNFMTLFIGKNNRSSISLVELDDDHLLAMLEGKIINIVSDLDSSKMKIRAFKLYVGNEAMITINRKFKEPYNIPPTAKMIYSCNNTFPKIPSDTDKGFFRKWSIIECPFEFDDNEDREILLKLLDESEKSGFLNELHMSFGDLYLRDGFEEVYNDFQEVKNLWFIKSNSFLQFLQEVAEVGQYETVAKNINNQYWEYPQTVVDSFNDYRLHKLNQPAIGQKTLTNLIKYAPEVRLTKRTIKGKQVKVYAGLKLTDKPLINTINIFNDKKEEK
jgi:putative DNA primase/helicase